MCAGIADYRYVCWLHCPCQADPVCEGSVLSHELIQGIKLHMCRNRISYVASIRVLVLGVLCNVLRIR